MPSVIYDKGVAREIDVIELFPAQEGELNQIHGRIGNGKTMLATMMVLEDLSYGEVVYVNWPINWNGYDERNDWFRILRNLLFFKPRFYSFRSENLKRIAIDENFADTLESLNNCKIYLDEGHVAFDSYEMAKMSMQKRAAILHTRHFNRTINVISQRPTAIHTTIRDNVNRFYRMEKLLTWPFLVFRRTETQDIDSSGKPDYSEDVPTSSKLFFPPKRVLEAYNTRYLGEGIEPSQTPQIDAYDLSITQRMTALYFALGGRTLQRRSPRAIPRGPIAKKYSWDKIKPQGPGT